MSAHTARTGRPAHVWFPAEDQRLEALWTEGLSSTAIAARMKTTKGSILGRAHRLLLAPRPNPSKHRTIDAATAAARLRAMTDKLAQATAHMPSKAPTLPVEPDLAAAAPQHPTEPETPPAGNVGPVKAMSARLKNWIDTAGAPRDCQWPIGHPKRPGFRFCLNETEPAKPYCYGHCRIAYINFGTKPIAHPDRVYVPTWLQSR